MSTSFLDDIDSTPGNHVYDDEALAIQLLAEELALVSPTEDDQTKGLLFIDSPQTVDAYKAYATQGDLELARTLQVREDEQSMVASTKEDSRTDLEVAKMLQVDADEEMVADSATADRKSDLELAKLLQQQEDIASSDFFIAQQLQKELEQEGADKCQRCGQQSCQGHPYCSRGYHERRGRHDAGANDYETSRDAMFHQVFQSVYELPEMELGEDDEDDEDYESLLELGDTIGEARSLGLQQEEMDTLPTCRFNSNSQSAQTARVESDSDSSNCHICLCAFSDDDILRTLPCLHRFHRDCVDQWLQRKAVCPICRVEIKDHIPGSSAH